MERYTLSKRVGMRAEAEVRAEFLRARFSQIGSGKNGYGSIWKTADTFPRNRSIFHDYSVIGRADFSTNDFAIRFSTQQQKFLISPNEILDRNR